MTDSMKNLDYYIKGLHYSQCIKEASQRISKQLMRSNLIRTELIALINGISESTFTDDVKLQLRRLMITYENIVIQNNNNVSELQELIKEIPSEYTELHNIATKVIDDHNDYQLCNQDALNTIKKLLLL